MASVYIARYVHKTGIRWVVRYRLGGRTTPVVHAGSFRSLDAAEEHRDFIRLRIAAGQIVGLYSAPKTKRPQLVYFARLGNLIKIGVSVDPRQRTRSLNAELLHVEKGGRSRERELHELFQARRQDGEWFTYGGSLKHYLDRQEAA
jgi:hypothetical protein